MYKTYSLAAVDRTERTWTVKCVDEHAEMLLKGSQGRCSNAEKRLEG